MWQYPDDRPRVDSHFPRGTGGVRIDLCQRCTTYAERQLGYLLAVHFPREDASYLIVGLTSSMFPPEVVERLRTA